MERPFKCVQCDSLFKVDEVEAHHDHFLPAAARHDLRNKGDPANPTYSCRHPSGDNFLALSLDQVVAHTDSHDAESAVTAWKCELCPDVLQFVNDSSLRRDLEAHNQIHRLRMSRKPSSENSSISPPMPTLTPSLPLLAPPLQTSLLQPPKLIPVNKSRQVPQTEKCYLARQQKLKKLRVDISAADKKAANKVLADSIAKPTKEIIHVDNPNAAARTGFKCLHCGAVFRRPDTLQVHFLVKHKHKPGGQNLKDTVTDTVSPELAASGSSSSAVSSSVSLELAAPGSISSAVSSTVSPELPGRGSSTSMASLLISHELTPRDSSTSMTSLTISPQLTARCSSTPMTISPELVSSDSSSAASSTVSPKIAASVSNSSSTSTTDPPRFAAQGSSSSATSSSNPVVSSSAVSKKRKISAIENCTAHLKTAKRRSKSPASVAVQSPSNPHVKQSNQHASKKVKLSSTEVSAEVKMLPKKKRKDEKWILSQGARSHSSTEEQVTYVYLFEQDACTYF